MQLEYVGCIMLGAYEGNCTVVSVACPGAEMFLFALCSGGWVPAFRKLHCDFSDICSCPSVCGFWVAILRDLKTCEVVASSEMKPH